MNVAVSGEVLLFAAVSLHLLYLVYRRRQQKQQKGQEAVVQEAPASAQPAQSRYTAYEIVQVRASVVRSQQLWALELDDLELDELPVVPGLEHIRRMHLRLSSPDMPLPGLADMAQLSWLTLLGPPLQKRTLQLIEQLPNLQCLDLSQCRTVVDENNSVAGFCKAEDIYQFQRRRKLTTLLLPAVAYFRIGKIVKPFPKANVVVVALAHPLRLGDMVCLQRQTAVTERSSMSGTRWQSAATTVSSIRTDDHRQLEDAVPDLSKGAEHIDNQVAIPAPDTSKAGDELLWCGHAAIAQLRIQGKA